VKWFAIIAYVAGVGFIVAFVVVVWLVVRSLPG
jgi:hypothetical protein